MRRFPRAGRVRLLLAPGLTLVALATWVLGMARGQEGLPKVGQRKEKAPATALREPDKKPAPKPKPALAAGEWSASVEPEGQIFPSLLVASATVKPEEEDVTESLDAAADAKPGERPKAKDEALAPVPLGDANGLIGVRLRLPEGARVPAHARVEVRENALMETSVWEGDLTEKDQEYAIQPPMVYKFDALLAVRQPHPLNVALRVAVNGSDLGQRGVTAWVHSLNDCLYAYQNPDDPNDFQDLAWMFAAYVNEDHPAVRTLLREAQASGAVDGFDGYQSEEPGQVLRQVFALWSALHRRGLRYADIGATSSARESTWNMHVRFLDESLDDRQANCVDGSVLLASVLRKIGLHPCLVLAPGHMYLGFDLDREGHERAYLETTLLGNKDEDLDPFSYQKALEKAAPRAVRRLPGWKSFHAALDSAGRDYRENQQKYERDDDPEYQVIDVEAARRQGVFPIAHEGRN